MTATRLGARKWLTIVLVGLDGAVLPGPSRTCISTSISTTRSRPTRTTSPRWWAGAPPPRRSRRCSWARSRTGLASGRLLIGCGYILWGVSTAAFGLVTVENAAKLFPAASAVSAAAIMIVVLDCVMTFFGSTANDAAFNAWLTDATDETNRGRPSLSSPRCRSYPCSSSSASSTASRSRGAGASSSPSSARW